ncbi:MAG: hypothetical protein HFE67_05430 [Erysipelotrichaceae bacterium]|nr:hypothetical protein [Erysipelotrichaceae bacterium]
MEKQADKQKGKQANRQTQGKKDKQKQSEKANSSLSAALKTIPSTTSDKQKKSKKNANQGTKKKTNASPTKKSANGNQTSHRADHAKQSSISGEGAQRPLGERIKEQLRTNYLLWITIVVIAIPCLILAYILIGSRENSSTPVEGSRFADALDPKISPQEVNTLKEALQFADAQSVEVNLKSATLRITIDTRDDMTQEEMSALLGQVYDAVGAQLPIETYFTNKTIGSGDDATVIKMYDLEISIYNFIPENEEQKASQIHISRSKNAAAPDLIDDVLTTPRDEESAQEILHPDTSNPPVSQEEQTEGE